MSSSQTAALFNLVLSVKLPKLQNSKTLTKLVGSPGQALAQPLVLPVGVVGGGGTGGAHGGGGGGGVPLPDGRYGGGGGGRETTTGRLHLQRHSVELLFVGDHLHGLQVGLHSSHHLGLETVEG